MRPVRAPSKKRLNLAVCDGAGRRTLTARWPALALVLLMTGCGYWGRRPIDLSPPLKPHDPVWIWSHDTVSKWHDVVLTQDSASGIPFGTSRDCYAWCRRSIPRVQVDSMKQGYRTLAQNVTAVTGITILALFVEFEVCDLAHIPDCG